MKTPSNEPALPAISSNTAAPASSPTGAIGQIEELRSLSRQIVAGNEPSLPGVQKKKHLRLTYPAALRAQSAGLMSERETDAVFSLLSFPKLMKDRIGHYYYPESLEWLKAQDPAMLKDGLYSLHRMNMPIQHERVALVMIERIGDYLNAPVSKARAKIYLDELMGLPLDNAVNWEEGVIQNHKYATFPSIHEVKEWAAAYPTADGWLKSFASFLESAAKRKETEWLSRAAPAGSIVSPKT